MPEFRDCVGHVVSWEEPPRRIVSLVPSQTELLFDLGLADQIVGVTRFCVHPTEAKRDKVVVGGTKDFRVERIAALEPDLVIGNKEENTREGIEALAERWPTWVSDVADLEGALTMIREVGALTGKAAASERMALEIRGRFEEYGSQASASAAPRRVAYLIWREPYMVAAAGTFIDSMLRSAGWVNAFGDLERYPEVSLEQFAEASLDWVLLSSEPYPFKQRHITELKGALSADSDAEVALIDGEIFSWYGSRLLHAPGYLRSLR